MDSQEKTVDFYALHKKYIECLKSLDEFIPSWLLDVDFQHSNEIDGTSMLLPEHNIIVYSDKASEHAIIHEFEHLRSRHNNLSVGWDDEFEKNVYFYFIGFREYGANGLFLEEGFNEIASRRIYLKMLEMSKKSKQQAFSEYKHYKYYTHEMLTCIALCMALGENIDFFLKLKTTGNTAGQDAIAGKINMITGKPSYWKQMQSYLDDYELAKRVIPNGHTEKQKYLAEYMQNYYTMVYDMLFNAFQNGNISRESLIRRMELFECYSNRTVKLNPKLLGCLENAKKTSMLNHMQTISKGHLFYEISANREKIEKGSSFVYRDIVTKIPYFDAKSIVKNMPLVLTVKSLRNLPIEEKSYGLVWKWV